MNIFYLHSNPKKIAEYHNNKHCVKMVLETAQLLSTAHQLNNSPYSNYLYKKTHINHPSNIWVRSNKKHYAFTYKLFKELLKEYSKRYGRKHKCSELIPYLSFNPIKFDSRFKQPPQCMPNKYKTRDCIKAYRNYYLGEKLFSGWKFKIPPFVRKCYYSKVFGTFIKYWNIDLL